MILASFLLILDYRNRWVLALNIEALLHSSERVEKFGCIFKSQDLKFSWF